MSIKIIYGVGVILGIISYYFLPAFITLKIKDMKADYPCLYKLLYNNQDEPINKKEFIGIVNYVLIGLLIAFTPFIHYIIAILFATSFNETCFNGIMFFIEEIIKENYED